LPLLARELADASGIASWVGGVGLGVCAAGQEVYETPAAAVMTASLPADRFRLFGATDDPAADLPRRHANWIEAVSPTLALVHGDPRCDNLLRATVDTAAASGAFLVGGLVSHRCPEPLLAGDITASQRAASALGKAGRAGRPDPLLSARPGERPHRYEPHVAPAQRPAPGPAEGRGLRQLHRPRHGAVRRARGRDGDDPRRARRFSADRVLCEWRDFARP